MGIRSNDSIESRKSKRRKVSNISDGDKEDLSEMEDGMIQNRGEDGEEGGDDDDSEIEIEGNEDNGGENEEGEREEDSNDFENNSLPADPNDFAPGSVVSVVMKNFVVYSNITYHLGNSLNLVIGPNGTGKSSLIAALCLGLGGKPENLGARKLEEYIKTGCDSATIEIEIKAPANKNNYFIRRTIKEHKTSTWALNNQPSNQKKIMELTKELRIQVDNLCQFLPQERVAEFAELNAQQRLRSTEQAIGSIDLLERHDLLIDKSKQLDNRSRSKYEDEANLINLKDELVEKNKQVDSITAYTNLKNEYDALIATVPFCEYNELKEREQVLKVTYKEIKKQIEQAKKRNDSMRPRYENSTQRLKECNRNNELFDDENKRLIEQSDNSHGLISQLKNELTYCKNKIPGIIHEGKSFQADLKQSKDKLNKLLAAKESYQEVDYEVELENINLKLQENRDSITEAKNLRSEKKDEFDERLHNERDPIAKKINDGKNRLRDMSDANRQRIHFVEGIDGSDGKQIINAYKHLNSIKDKFTRKVHPPAYLSLTIKDPSCIALFSSMVSKNSMSSFVCETREDYETFTREIIDKLNMNVNVVEYSGAKFKTYQEHPSPIDKELLIENGFDGYLIDLLEAHPVVLNMLCFQEKIHAIPFAKSRIINSNMENFLKNKNFIGRCGDKKKIITYSRSSYGRRLLSTSTRTLSEPYWCRVFRTTSNPQQMRDLERDIQVYEEELKEFDESIKSLQKEIQLCNEKVHELDIKGAEFRKKKSDLAENSKRLGKITASIESLKEEIDDKEANQPQIHEKIKKVEEKINSIAENLYIEFQKVGGYLDKEINLSSTAIELNIQNSIIQREIRVYDTILNSGYEHLLNKEADIKREGNEVHKLVIQKKSLLQKLDKEERQELMTRAKNYKTKSELDIDIERVKAKMELDSTNNMGVKIEELIESRNILQSKINELETRIENHESFSSELENEIKEIASTWEPEITRLIDQVSKKFGEMFAKAGNRGEVRLNKGSHGLYEDWSLDILVSFRETSSLQVLNAQRQSGGERAVSTSLYLMALQGLAQSPFRVVDEINQGMDPTNERMVHDLMVNIACEENTSQYFLVTPKLLRDLPYHKRMKVCCIYSGEHISEGVVKELVVSDVIKRLKVLKDS